MPRLKKKDEQPSPPEAAVTLTAGRSRRTIKPNRKYLNDSVVLATSSKGASRDSSPESDVSEDDYRQQQEDDDDEEIVPKSAAGRKSTTGGPQGSAKKVAVAAPGSKPRGRPPKSGVSGGGITKTEPVKNLRKEVLKKMDLTTLSLGKARVVLTPLKDIKRQLDLDQSIEKGKTPLKGKPAEKEVEKSKPKVIAKDKEPEKPTKDDKVKPAWIKAREEKEKAALAKAREEKAAKELKAKEEKEKKAALAKAEEEKQKAELAKAKEEKEKMKSKPTLVRVNKVDKKQPTDSAGNEGSLKKVINPVAMQRNKVEKSILSQRSKTASMTTEEEAGEDDDDDVQIVGISREVAPNVVRKQLRKSPLVAKQISPIAKKPMVKPTTISKVIPPAPVSIAAQKRKATDSDSELSKPAKRGRPAKLSITLDSDDTEGEESFRRSTRSSGISDKGASPAVTPQSSSLKGKESPASAGAKLATKGTTEVVKSSMSKSISMPALNKVKSAGAKPVAAAKPVAQTPAPKMLSKPMAQSTPKPIVSGVPLSEKKSKSEVNLVDPIHSPERGLKASDKKKKDSATIRIVDIGDIIKKKSASTPDIRKVGNKRKSSQEEEDTDEEEEEYPSDSEDSDIEMSSEVTGNAAEKPKTNNQLVATILERKRAINLDHLRANRPVKRGRPAAAKQPAQKPAAGRSTVVNLTVEDGVDFEDMLQTNIVTANKVQKQVPTAVMRGRKSGADENITTGTKTSPSNKSPATSGVKTLASSNNNNVYKSNNNGRYGSVTSLNRSGSSSPHKNPPRILNSTMKLGDNRPFSKLVASSDNNHYSIDLTDPDNNVKLIASAPESPAVSPIKRSPVKTTTVPRPIVASAGLRNASNALNKPVGGAVQRSISSLTSAAGSSPKMKKITCYETWHVINIPNVENKPEKPSFAMSMIGLGNEAANIQLPSKEWSHKIILTKRKTPPSGEDEVFSGEVEDRAITSEEKRNYEPCNIMFRRKTATPGKFNLQYDRAVIFKNDTFFINVDGKNCQLVGAPTKLDGTDDIEVLLSVVDFVNLKNSCVELSAA